MEKYEVLIIAIFSEIFVAVWIPFAITYLYCKMKKKCVKITSEIFIKKTYGKPVGKSNSHVELDITGCLL